MKLSSLIAARPVFFFIFLTAKRMEQEVDLSSNNLRSVILSEIEITARLLHPLSSSATNLARVMNCSLNSKRLSFSEINTRVAPSLFQAFSTIPHMSEISYIGLDGLFFSYYIDNNQTLAMYCNSSSAPDQPSVYANTNCYTQPVDGYTGNLYGEATVTSPLNIKSSLLQEALNSTSGFASLGSGLNKAGDPLFLNTASINGRGAVSLGFPVKAITNFFTGMNLYGGSFSMATNDGQVLVEGLPNTRMIVVDNFIFFQSNKTINGNQQQTSDNIVYVEYCKPGVDSYHILNIGEKDYKVYCSPLELAGVKLVYALTVPRKEEGSLVHKTNEFELTLLIVMISSIVISVLSFVYLMVRSARREMHMCAALINQMEATQQAERKSMNKSLAFASASHDVRAALAGLNGLIEICFLEVAYGSELDTNLRLMDSCSKDLMGLLNSILDTSKIDAGKMQLEEEEFNIGQLLEDVVDLYHPVAMKKEVDVVLDPFDGSLNKYSHVKGDRGKLKQVLCNLLSNAVKFTSEGHVTVRSWVQKPNLEKSISIIESNRNGFLCRMSCLFFNNKKAQNDIEAVNAVQKNPNYMEFVFEVDDTGKGIPKEKQQSVFENYVQVKDGLGGTGLGLGIVQSLVRLMGGEIKIVDKGIGEKGTCFRFNVFLTIDEANSVDNARADVELVIDSTYGRTVQHKGLTVLAPSPSLTIRTSSPRMNRLLSPKLVGSQVVLLIANEERRRVSLKYMEHLGINVSIVDRWESLHSILRKMKNKLGHSPHSSVGKSDLGSQYENSGASLKDVPLSALEGTDYRVPSYRPGFVLLVIDATAGPFSELFRVVTEFRRDVQCRCKVVWLDKPTSRSINFNDFEEEEEMMDSKDDIISKPLHGSRLTRVIRHLPEFGAPFSPGGFTRPPRSEQAPSSSHARHSPMIRASQGTHPRRGHRIQHSDTQEEDSSSSDKYSTKDVHSTAPGQTHGRLRTTHSSSSQIYKTTQTEIEEEAIIDEKPLTGKKFLVADDNIVGQKLARVHLTQLGATVEVCKNGEEALQLVRNGLKDRTEHDGPQILPYDYILMDCEMPIMNGFEATKQIRKEEKYYAVHIPIIALTAHVSGKEAENTILAGMDVHLGKPPNKENLLEAIRYINNK
ncbi:hypothetical protein EZV62_010305 [Acer yangbiense]|uniref:histidine kinase n=1 Tax=Acer yangbiense TaxID=1000413 RepID=A0A5C7I209_9ROSI|nr:hypothetical protein EZV62_010305 [Acer yangbiense]